MANGTQADIASQRGAALKAAIAAHEAARKAPSSTESQKTLRVKESERDTAQSSFNDAYTSYKASMEPDNTPQPQSYFLR